MYVPSGYSEAITLSSIVSRRHKGHVSFPVSIHARIHVRQKECLQERLISSAVMREKHIAHSMVTVCFGLLACFMLIEINFFNVHARGHRSMNGHGRGRGRAGFGIEKGHERAHGFHP